MDRVETGIDFLREEARNALFPDEVSHQEIEKKIRSLGFDSVSPSEQVRKWIVSEVVEKEASFLDRRPVFKTNGLKVVNFDFVRRKMLFEIMNGNENLSLVDIDLDKLKFVNGAGGHDRGNISLSSTVGALVKAINYLKETFQGISESLDFFIGNKGAGDEFVVLIVGRKDLVIDLANDKLNLAKNGNKNAQIPIPQALYEVFLEYMDEVDCSKILSKEEIRKYLHKNIVLYYGELIGRVSEAKSLRDEIFVELFSRFKIQDFAGELEEAKNLVLEAIQIEAEKEIEVVDTRYEGYEFFISASGSYLTMSDSNWFNIEQYEKVVEKHIELGLVRERARRIAKFDLFMSCSDERMKDNKALFEVNMRNCNFPDDHKSDLGWKSLALHPEITSRNEEQMKAERKLRELEEKNCKLVSVLEEQGAILEERNLLLSKVRLVFPEIVSAYTRSAESIVSLQRSMQERLSSLSEALGWKDDDLNSFDIEETNKEMQTLLVEAKKLEELLNDDSTPIH